MRSSWRRRALNAMTGILLRDRKGDTDTEEKAMWRGGRDLSDGATIPGMPGVPRSWERQEEFSSLWREHSPADTSISQLRSPGPGEVPWLLF